MAQMKMRRAFHKTQLWGLMSLSWRRNSAILAWNGVNVSILAHKWSKNGAEWSGDGGEWRRMQGWIRRMTQNGAFLSKTICITASAQPHATNAAKLTVFFLDFQKWAHLMFLIITSKRIKLQSRANCQIAGNSFAILNLMSFLKIGWDLTKIRPLKVTRFSKVIK